jgi:hypothetical protein
MTVGFSSGLNSCFFLVAEVLNCRTLWKFEWSVDLGFGSGCIGGAKGGVGGHGMAGVGSCND